MAKTKLTPEIQKRICDIIAVSGCKKEAATTSGITESTFYNWMAWGEKAKSGKYFVFFESVKKAEDRFRLSLVSTIKAASKGTWQAAAWLLERKYFNEYGKRAPVDIDKPDTLKPTIMTDQELEAIASGND